VDNFDWLNGTEKLLPRHLSLQHVHCQRHEREACGVRQRVENVLDPDGGMVVKQYTAGNFDREVLASERPVLISFSAAWCRPCRALDQALDELSARFGDLLAIGRIDVEEQAVLPPRYGVRGIPTLMLFKGGEIAATKVGAPSPRRLHEWVEEVV
jgi:thioredoxin 1